MIEVLDRSSGKVLGIRVRGKLLHEDYQQFVPLVEKLIKQHGGIRCLVEMIDLHGLEPRALWDEIKFDVRHAGQIERLCCCRRSCLGSLDDLPVSSNILQRRDSVL